MRVNRFVLDNNVWISYFMDILDEKENLEKKYPKLKIITKIEFESKFKI